MTLFLCRDKNLFFHVCELECDLSLWFGIVILSAVEEEWSPVSGRAYASMFPISTGA